ncbi:MAG: PIN domain-containing protein [Candidatus Nanohaloarchaea archaeon]|nr:PIN domain-containing protein [Candidatus Nanohaloarchaea archaeon]
MIYALDTNVLLDVLYATEDHHQRSKKVLEEASQDGTFIVSPEVYAELVSAFAEKCEAPQEEATTFLEEEGIVVKEHSRDSLARSGTAWSEYDASGSVECSSCGTEQHFTCEACSEPVTWRNHMITDFLIGGHAETHADRLITRDEGYFGTYFDMPVHYPAT